MHIRKIGQCCLVITTNGKKILTDPGSYSTAQDQEKDIDIILITHEHGDHLHMDSVKKIFENNPNAKIITNTAVGALLEKEGIAYEVLEHGHSKTEQGIMIEGFGEIHEEIYRDFGRVQNTGYFIENKLFYPGDAFTDPGKHVEILALPVAGPWMKISEAINYALLIKPRVAFPVHDAIMKKTVMTHWLPQMILPQNDIEFVSMVEGDEHEF